MRKISVIPSGMTLVGDIEGDADLVVYGRVEGPIHVGGTLVIEGSGVVRGHVRASAVIVRGVLKGNAFGDDLVRVDEGARLVGELTAPRVQVVPGAHFRGQIHVATVGEPRLTSYDPTLHTFSGWPSPEPFAVVGSSLGSAAAPSAPELSTGASTTFDKSFASVGLPHVGEAPDFTLLETSAPDRTQVVDPVDSETAVTLVFQPAAQTSPAAGPHVSHASVPQAHDPAATHVSPPAAPLAAHASEPRPHAVPYAQATRESHPAPHVSHAAAPHDAYSAPHDDAASKSLEIDATLSEATYPPPPERLPLRMPRLGGRTPGTRRWT